MNINDNECATQMKRHKSWQTMNMQISMCQKERQQQQLQAFALHRAKAKNNYIINESTY